MRGCCGGKGEQQCKGSGDLVLMLKKREVYWGVTQCLWPGRGKLKVCLACGGLVLQWLGRDVGLAGIQPPTCNPPHASSKPTCKEVHSQREGDGKEGKLHFLVQVAQARYM